MVDQYLQDWGFPELIPVFQGTNFYASVYTGCFRSKVTDLRGRFLGVIQGVNFKTSHPGFLGNKANM